MKKLVFVCLCLVGFTMFMGSCKSKQPKEAFNDSIQGTFFGVSFGAEKEEIEKKFAEHNLTLLYRLSTEEVLHFGPLVSNRYTFGGMNWENLYVVMSNGNFWQINFYNTFRDKAEAISSGESLVSTVSAKYELVKEEPEDSTIYMIYRGKSKKEPEREVCVYIERYEGVDKTIYYGEFLRYLDRKYKASVSDEL